MTALQAIRRWRQFADSCAFKFGGAQRTWAQHLDSRGATDEETILQPIVFPRFAEALLGFAVGDNLAAEQAGEEGRPDFTPADAMTHPFVFEIKSTRYGVALEGHSDQVGRYLREGRPRIRRVVLTNLRGLRVFSLDNNGDPHEDFSVDLRGLLRGPEDTAALTGEAARLAQFLEEFSFKQLSLDEKLDRLRGAPEWNPHLEVTNPSWLSQRLDRTVEQLRVDVHQSIQHGALNGPGVTDADRRAITVELHELEWRAGEEWEESHGHSLTEYSDAADSSPAGIAFRQYVAHVAYYAATRMLLVRMWEDLELLPSVLHDGGLDHWMESLDDAIESVVEHSYLGARTAYPSLFSGNNNYTWYSPTRGTLIEALYQLGNTYLGDIRSDVLGEVYERLLERVNRQLIGQYYTPRDIISLIWDLIELGDEDRSHSRVLDIATGSAGFLVEAARRIRDRQIAAQEAGAALSTESIISGLAQDLVGVEIQRFPAYLAELNLLMQVGELSRDLGTKAVPAFGILCQNTLAFHNPEQLNEEDPAPDEGLLTDDPFRESHATSLKDPSLNSDWFDVACGNPPYVGERRASSELRRTRERFPYWNNFVAPHLDYLYWFLILGISKLRQGGRFGFITTEYWLRAEGARPLRKYIADRCQIDRIILFRDLRLFPDAPGQHSMIITGTRAAPADPELPTSDWQNEPLKPRISIYHEKNLPIRERSAVLDRMRSGSRGNGVAAFQSQVSPNHLRGSSWAEVILNSSQLTARRRLRENAQPLEFDMSEGVITAADAVHRGDDEDLTQAVLRRIAWPEGRTGIFVLDNDEIAALGTLQPAEREIVRPILNTRDVFPYAVVPSQDANRMIYLPAPPRDNALTREQIQSLPFPNGLPNLDRHLKQFKHLLLKKVGNWNEKRPWWSVHRPRAEIFENDNVISGWSNYALTTRKGSGGQLLVGLAPPGHVPQSGMHALLPHPGGEIAYLVGVLNSSVVQALADSMPPGVIRQEDLEMLGIPQIPGAETEIATHTRSLASIVDSLVREHGERWPLLSAHLRTDIDLSDLPTDTWLASHGNPASWGPMEDIGWITSIESGGSRTQPASEASVDWDLFGAAIRLRNRQGGWMAIRPETDDQDVIDALRRYVNGISAAGVSIKDLPSRWIPIETVALADKYSADLAAMTEIASTYRQKRSRIDELVTQFF